LLHHHIFLSPRLDISLPGDGQEHVSGDVSNLIEYVIAPHDPEFEVTWLSGTGVVEGSPDRGFRTVRLVGYESNLIERAVAALGRVQRANNPPQQA
jgi:hypothetical protein